MPESVQPLRISKTTPNSSPQKMTSQGPLSEISATAQRRNSPSFNQVTKTMMFNKESSPFDSPPSRMRSPHAFWQGRDPSSPTRFMSENSPANESASQRRSSIENLKKASRVKNSSMFDRERQHGYDPASAPVLVERPLAAGRPLSTQLQYNNFYTKSAENIRDSPNPFKGHRRGESQSKIPLFTASQSSPQPMVRSNAPSPAKVSTGSPVKSSLSNGRWSLAAQSLDRETDSWSDDDEFKTSTPRPLRRIAKSVTFDAAPPQVNEYEMVTPDPSSVASGSREGSFDSMDEYDDGESYERGSSAEREDSFDASLEDTAKTPVVLPGYWPNMSLDHESMEMNNEDPFGGSPAQGSQHSVSVSKRLILRRSESVNSDGSEARPLPPLPGFSPGKSRRESAGLSATAERVGTAQRNLPSPPRPAAISKADILNMREGSMTLEDRLGLMGIQDSPVNSGTRRASKEVEAFKIHEDSADDDDTPVLEDYKIPRISRESILRKVKSRHFNQDEEQDSMPSSPERNYADLDPDVPIPSRECSSNFDVEVPDVPIKREEDEEEETVDVYSIPELYSVERSESQMDDYARDGSVIRHDIHGSKENDNDDEGSRYSGDSGQEDADVEPSKEPEDEKAPSTPKAEPSEKADFFSLPSQKKEARGSLPEFSTFLEKDDFSLGLAPYITSTKNASPKALGPVPSLFKPRPDLRKESVEPEQSIMDDETELDTVVDPEDEERPDSPESVIHHAVAIEPVHRDSPVIPEPVATIKAPGGGLKTRPSITPGDMSSMAAARRQVSGQQDEMDGESTVSSLSDEAEERTGSFSDSEVQPTRRQSLKMKLDLPSAALEDDFLGLDKEFDRVIEAQKKGYLMRQNTKVVVASSRKFSDEKRPGSSSSDGAASQSTSGSPRKPSNERILTTEPWNGKVRRKSSRQSSGGVHKRPLGGPVPPLPGQESVVTSNLGTVVEGQTLDEGEEPVERGRLFAKVVGVKDLDLPLPSNERTWFQLTLDNGLHCVTTAWLELGRSAPIGQEFELVVLNDLEFQLTLQTKLTPPSKPAAPLRSNAPSRPIKPQKSSVFNRLLGSPKKRKDAERRQQEEADRLALEQQEREREAKRSRAPPSAWDLLHDLVAPDGSFARAYICLKAYESQAYGRPLIVDVPCYNEWAVEDDKTASSVKSKHGGVARRPPYKVGKLTLQLLYVPKPKGAKDEDMPKSMNSAMRELKEAEQVVTTKWEGCLSQQGGDCPYWRRRFFRLNGTKLTAYHESTRQPRCTMNLAKATKLIDDRSSLIQPDGTKAKSRRRSAFAEEEEGYMFVEEGFRIRFANGECIDFYADNADDKIGWMKVLAEVIGRDASSSGKAWTEMVLSRERSLKRTEVPPPPRKDAARDSVNGIPMAPPPAQRSSARSAPTSPVKPQREALNLPPEPVRPINDHSHSTTKRMQQKMQERRKNVRSMIF